MERIAGRRQARAIVHCPHPRVVAIAAHQHS
jgi:hypothetical protein